MGQKIHPIGFRLAVNKNWSSRWFANAKSFGPMLNEDLKVREYLKKKLSHASVSKVVIERPAKDARITIHSARPGVVIGKKGEDIEMLKADLRRLLGVQMVHVNIEEVRKPEVDAQLIADSIGQQLEKRIMFRRAMKRAMQNAMRLGAQGIKIMSAGRLNGIEIARTEWYREGRVPLHTLRADIDYGFSEAKTTYGVIGIKVWVYKGEVAGKGDQPAAPALPSATEERAATKRVKKSAVGASAKIEGAQAQSELKAEGRREAGADVKPKPARPRTRKVVTGDASAKTDTSAAPGSKPEETQAAKPKAAVKRTRKPKEPPAGSGEKQ
ncbi:MAG: 30S ribosomal protein S3 [Betaproteobacteria bacterium RIFCSPLOWO2_12_FULL_63_13]|nr:MAG: 30S ribosomal protein S3 [Betaproteobacteria bacterium RIFCSPLOWO2_02_FULL_63_19]OGA45595.1 MAG: 30S ribosomal protein S3 [Betaproteobacteria bacterium RIFCSPLOWO2_12_FULL_63_13]